MKIKQTLLLSAVLATALSSCADDKEYSYDAGKPVLFSTTIGDHVQPTYAADNAWGAGDAIGIFMKTGAGLGTIVDNAENKKYTTTGSGSFIPAAPAESVFFPTNGNPVDFVAYYPYTAAVAGNVYKVDVADQTSQEKIDLLYSNNATGQTAASTVALNFKHQLSKVVFTINAGNNVPDLTGLKVVIEGMNTKADFALADKTLTPTVSVADITFKTTVNGTTAVAEGIILPTTGTTVNKVSFILPIGTFVWSADTQVFDAGKKNTYTVELKKGGAATVLPGATIEDWGPGSSEGIIIDLNDGSTGAGDGTQAAPFSITEAKANGNATAKWVIGYIVGSTSKTKAFGTPSKDNILIAESATETNEANCIILDLVGSSVQEFLNIVDNTNLIGKQIKVEGNIVSNLFGGAIALTALTAQEGGEKPGEVTPPAGETKVFFKETFPGEPVKNGTKWPNIAAYTGWDMGSPIVYSDPTTNSDVRKTSTLDPNVWLPSKGGSLVIEGIDGTYTDVKLTYDIASGSKPKMEVNIVKVTCNDGTVLAIPSTISEAANEYKKITIAIPNGTTKIEFKLAAGAPDGFRLDNIQLEGKK